VRKLIVSEFMTLDGVMEAPGFEDHPDGRNGWALRLQSEEMQRCIGDQIAAAGAILLGRVTYQIWAAFWPTAGEVEMRGGDIGGISVHIAGRALSEAWGGTIIVTRTVRDLASGTDLAFARLGSVALRGLPGEWGLFEAGIG
jgi:dihydrofolate reductase